MLLTLCLGVLIYFATSTTGFASWANLQTLLRDQPMMAILGLGMTVVILVRGIDLSIGSIEALSAVTMGVVWSHTHSGPAALAAALVTGAACGAINGVLIARWGMPPLIVTLATLSVFRGLAYAVGGSEPVENFPIAVMSLSYDFLGLPVPFWIALAILIGGVIYLGFTQGGRRIYALGLNPDAARLSGVQVQRMLLGVYLVNGLLCGLVAILYAARNNSVQANAGLGHELLAITYVVLGGTSVAGGSGTVTGTALAFLILVGLTDGLTLRGVPQAVQNVVVAGVLVAVLLLDAFRRGALRRS
jgi:ribose/xylose/arabinose/galactoside ABC-type transport system permease subunit